MLRLGVTVLAVLSLATLHANQTSAPSPADLDQIVTRVLESNATYVQVFRSLVAEETKDIQQFDKSGRVNKQRRIVSDLLVYQPTRTAATPVEYAVEYRDVREVDGKPVKKRSERALDVITRAMRSESLTRELEVIDRENQRYDLNFRMNDATVNQGGLKPQFRLDYLVDWVGREQVDGHEVVVLDYRSKTPKPQQDFLSHFGATAVAVRGRLWADAATFQLRRDRFEVVALHPNMPEPLLIIRREATYGESRFGVLTPQRVVGEWFDRTGGTQQKPSLTRAGLITFTYGAFRRFEVATEETIAAPGQAN